jgi:hypothetical protein
MVDDLVSAQAREKAVTPIDLAIHDIASALSNIHVKDDDQRLSIYIKTLESLVRFAISQNEVAQINGVNNDMQKIEEIRAEAKRW